MIPIKDRQPIHPEALAEITADATMLALVSTLGGSTTTGDLMRRLQLPEGPLRVVLMRLHRSGKIRWLPASGSQNDIWWLPVTEAC